ncbi:helix-turn-helix domain-containing protein [Pseudomonadota bacterium]
MEEDILTSEQVAQILQVHPFTVLKFIKQGKLRASKLGRVYRIRRSDVDAFLESLVEAPDREEKQVKKSTSKKRSAKKEKVIVEGATEELESKTPGIDHYTIELTEE